MFLTIVDLTTLICIHITVFNQLFCICRVSSQTAKGECQISIFINAEGIYTILCSQNSICTFCLDLTNDREILMTIYRMNSVLHDRCTICMQISNTSDDIFYIYIICLLCLRSISNCILCTIHMYCDI